MPCSSVILPSSVHDGRYVSLARAVTSKSFVATKMILVAASSRQWWLRYWTMSETLSPWSYALHLLHVFCITQRWSVTQKERSTGSRVTFRHLFLTAWWNSSAGSALYANVVSQDERVPHSTNPGKLGQTKHSETSMKPVHLNTFKCHVKNRRICRYTTTTTK